MSLKEYDVIVDGRPTTLLLSDEDARAHGLHVPSHRAPEQPVTEPEPEAADTAAADEPETKAADAPDNKARTAANKNSDKRADAAARAFGGSKSDAGPDAG
ncbi:MAG: hypothetical protein E6R06_26080 [Mycobacterium sp.]|nr:MAG: hypothetical protein E6R06_26080 [Mycobacterium sp.]